MRVILFLDQTLHFRSSLNFRDTTQHLLEEINLIVKSNKKIQLQAEKYDKKY